MTIDDKKEDIRALLRKSIEEQIEKEETEEAKEKARELWFGLLDSLHFDRTGKPMTLFDWATKLESDPEYRSVGYTELPNGIRISTAWIGINSSPFSPKPIIFETMVFGPQTTNEQTCWRYATEEEAKAGHKEAVKMWSKKFVMINGQGTDGDNKENRERPKLSAVPKKTKRPKRDK